MVIVTSCGRFRQLKRTERSGGEHKWLLIHSDGGGGPRVTMTTTMMNNYRRDYHSDSRSQPEPETETYNNVGCVGAPTATTPAPSADADVKPTVADSTLTISVKDQVEINWERLSLNSFYIYRTRIRIPCVTCVVNRKNDCNLDETQSGEEAFFKVKTTTKMIRVFTAFSNRKKGLHISSIRFIYDGKRVGIDDTPESVRPKLRMVRFETHMTVHDSRIMHSQLGMEDQDQVDCMLEQTGGYSQKC